MDMVININAKLLPLVARPSRNSFWTSGIQSSMSILRKLGVHLTLSMDFIPFSLASYQDANDFILLSVLFGN